MQTHQQHQLTTQEVPPRQKKLLEDEPGAQHFASDLLCLMVIGLLVMAIKELKKKMKPPQPPDPTWPRIPR